MEIQEGPDGQEEIVGGAAKQGSCNAAAVLPPTGGAATPARSAPTAPATSHYPTRSIQHTVMHERQKCRAAEIVGSQSQMTTADLGGSKGRPHSGCHIFSAGYPQGESLCNHLAENPTDGGSDDDSQHHAADDDHDLLLWGKRRQNVCQCNLPRVSLSMQRLLWGLLKCNHEYGGLKLGHLLQWLLGWCYTLTILVARFQDSHQRAPFLIRDQGPSQ